MNDESKTGIEPLKWFGFISFLFLIGMIHSCMYERSRESCREICIGHGQEFSESKNKFWFIQCECGKEIKGPRRYLP